MNQGIKYVQHTLAIVGLLLASWGHGAEFDELQWLHPDADLISQLTYPPLDCVPINNYGVRNPPRTPPGARDPDFMINAGRELFQNPAVLADMSDLDGLSCNSCHVSGYGNADFYLDGLSSAPGTVDISNGRFSKFSANDSLAALSIPSLMDASERDSFGSEPGFDSIRAYMEAMLSGRNIPDSAIEALTAYVSALTTTAANCTNRQQQNVARSVGQVYFDLERSIQILQQAAQTGETAMTDLLFTAAMQHIDLLHRHYDIPATVSLADRIGRMKDELDSIRSQATVLSGTELSEQVGDWFWEMRGLRADLLSASQQSLYLKENLQQWLDENR